MNIVDEDNTMALWTCVMSSEQDQWQLEGKNPLKAYGYMMMISIPITVIITFYSAFIDARICAGRFTCIVSKLLKTKSSIYYYYYLHFIDEKTDAQKY